LPSAPAQVGSGRQSCAVRYPTATHASRKDTIQRFHFWSGSVAFAITPFKVERRSVSETLSPSGRGLGEGSARSKVDSCVVSFATEMARISP